MLYTLGIDHFPTQYEVNTFAEIFKNKGICLPPKYEGDIRIAKEPYTQTFMITFLFTSSSISLTLTENGDELILEAVGDSRAYTTSPLFYSQPHNRSFLVKKDKDSPLESHKIEYHAFDVRSGVYTN